MAGNRESSSIRPVLVASHERSGTHLLLDLLRLNFRACRARPAPGRNPHDWMYFSVDRLATDHPRAIGTSFADWAMARAKRPVLKSHALPGIDDTRPEAREWLDSTLTDAVKLYVVRDGRAVMPSYHRHCQSVDRTTPTTFAEFLRTPIRGQTPAQRWARHVTEWSANPGVHVVRFEDMLNQTGTVLARLAEILNEERSGKNARLPRRGSSAWGARLARFTGRLESSNLVERGPRTPRWTEVFTQDDLGFFATHAGCALKQLGYTEACADSGAPSAGGSAA